MRMAELSPYIGSIFGVRVQLHWTFILLLLFALGAAVAYGLYYLFTLVVLLFVCVFVHELFHSITAMRNKVTIKKIILLPLGGASVIDDRKPIRPDVEFRTAIVGPLASVFLGVVFGMATIYAPGGILKQALQFLFEINILLGVFNLLPGFPLDGGRVLRSWLQRKYDLMKATRKTVKVGNIFLVLFVIGTIVYAAVLPYPLADKEFIVLWDFIIAIFLYDGAKAELQGTYLKFYASGLKARDAISRDYVVVNANTPIRRLYGILSKAHVRVILVKAGGGTRAVLRVPQEKDFSRHSYRTAFDISAAIPQVREGSSLYGAISEMSSGNVYIAAVLRERKLVGVLTAQHVESILALRAQKMRGSRD